MRRYRIKTIATACYTHDVEAADVDEAMQIAEERVHEGFSIPDDVTYDSLWEREDEYGGEAL